MRDFIFKPGDYVLSDVTIAGTTGRQEIITDQIIELIIYEDIESS